MGHVSAYGGNGQYGPDVGGRWGMIAMTFLAISSRAFARGWRLRSSDRTFSPEVPLNVRPKRRDSLMLGGDNDRATLPGRICMLVQIHLTRSDFGRYSRGDPLIVKGAREIDERTPGGDDWGRKAHADLA